MIGKCQFSFIQEPNFRVTEEPTSLKVEVKSVSVFVIDGVEYNFSGYDTEVHRTVLEEVSIDPNTTLFISIHPIKTSQLLEVVIIRQIPYVEPEPLKVFSEPSVFPTYFIWPDGETELPQTVTSTSSASIATAPTGIERLNGRLAAKTRAIENWKNRLHNLALVFEESNHVIRWVEEDLKGTKSNPKICLAIEDTVANAPYVSMGDNAAVHWPKLIGLGWRIVSYYENPNYSKYPVALDSGFMHNGSAFQVSLNTTIAADSNIDPLISIIEAEFDLKSKKRSLYAWYMGAGKNETVWTGYYDSEQLWLSNVTNEAYTGSSMIYQASAGGTGANAWTVEDDWGDLYTEFKKCLIG